MTIWPMTVLDGLSKPLLPFLCIIDICTFCNS